MSAPKIADITIHISTAAVNSQGAAPRLIELNRRKCWAILRALLHRLATWYFNLGWLSTYIPNQGKFTAGSIFLSFTVIWTGFSQRCPWSWIASDFWESKETALFITHSSKLSTSFCAPVADSATVRPVPRIPMSSAYPKRALKFSYFIGSTRYRRNSIAEIDEPCRTQHSSSFDIVILPEIRARTFLPLKK